jgi:hypothetical protein
MDTDTKNALILAAGALGGAFVGRWAAPRIGAALGLTFGPWGSAAGAAIGGILGATLAKNMAGSFELPSLEGADMSTALKSD